MMIIWVKGNTVVPTIKYGFLLSLRN